MAPAYLVICAQFQTTSVATTSADAVETTPGNNSMNRKLVEIWGETLVAWRQYEAAAFVRRDAAEADALRARLMALDREEQVAHIATLFEAMRVLRTISSLAKGSDRSEAAELRRWLRDVRKSIWHPPSLAVEEGRRILRLAAIVDLQIDAGLRNRVRSIVLYLLRRHSQQQVVRSFDR